MKIVVLSAAVMLAIVASVIGYLIATGPLGEPMLMCADCDIEPPALEPMSVVDPIAFSAIFAIGAVAVYAVVARFVARPLRTFASLALVVLVVSLLVPARIPSPPVEASAKLVLMTLHVVGYSVIVGTLWLGHQRGWLHGRQDWDG